jgi:hypothetical protein
LFTFPLDHLVFPAFFLSDIDFPHPDYHLNRFPSISFVSPTQNGSHSSCKYSTGHDLVTRVTDPCLVGPGHKENPSSWLPHQPWKREEYCYR